MIFQIDSGPDTGFLSIPGSSRHLLLPSSKAAVMTALLPGPIPSVSDMSWTVIDAIAPSLPSDLARSLLATSRTFSFWVPEPMSIASSSALVRAPAPFEAIFSLGLSSVHSSFIFIFLSPLAV